MCEENDGNKLTGQSGFAAVQETPVPSCGRAGELAPDVTAEVMSVCPYCTGTGGTCLIDLMYAEAFPSRQQH